MASRLVFTPTRHTYALDGKRVPGVTTVIRNATDKPALVSAAAKEAAIWGAANRAAIETMGPEAWVRAATAAPRLLWRAKAERGTLLHEAARQLVRGDPLTPVTDGEQWPDDTIRAAENLARFMDEWDMDPLWTERPVFHTEDRWAGTIDAVATLRGGGRWLLDYKTSETGVYPESSMQLSAYRHATHIQVLTDDGLLDYPMPEVDRCAVVWVRPDGYEVRPVRADASTYAVFRHMLHVSAWVEWRHEDSIGEPLPIPEKAVS